MTESTVRYKNSVCMYVCLCVCVYTVHATWSIVSTSIIRALASALLNGKN